MRISSRASIFRPCPRLTRLLHLSWCSRSACRVPLTCCVCEPAWSPLHDAREFRDTRCSVSLSFHGFIAPLHGRSHVEKYVSHRLSLPGSGSSLSTPVSSPEW